MPTAAPRTAPDALRLPGARARLTEAAIVVTVLASLVTYVAPTLDRPLLEKHAFRQTQTAYTARIFHEQGIDLLHPQLPVFGEPYEVPFEFPLFQAMASIAMDELFRDDMAMRVTGLLCFLLTALLLYGLVRRVAGRVSALAALVAFTMTPLAIVWSRASMIEYLATAGALGFTWAAIRWRETRRSLPAGLALGAGLVGMLVKPTTAIFWIAPALLYRPDEPADDPAPRRTRAVTVALVALPLAAALLWTRHADAIKAASPATEWLTSRNLTDWNFGSLDQRFDSGAWAVIFKRLGPNVLGLYALFLPFAVVALVRSRQWRFWVGVVAAAFAPFLVFTNLYVAHDYYLAAVAPAYAALAGLGFGWIWSRLPRGAAPAATAAALSLLVVYGSLEIGRGYWLRVHGAEDDPQVLPLARELEALTTREDRVGVVGLTWSPAVLYYANRWGHMVTSEAEEVALDRIHDDGYRHVLVADPEGEDLSFLDRWRWVGALGPHTYAVADTRADLPQAAVLATDDASALPPGSALVGSGLEIRCGEPVEVAGGRDGTWIRFERPPAGSRLRVSSEHAPLPVRDAVYVGPAVARSGRLTLTCSGTPSLLVTRTLGARP